MKGNRAPKATLKETRVTRGNPKAQSEHTGQRWESNFQPQRCEANTLTLKPVFTRTTG